MHNKKLKILPLFWGLSLKSLLHSKFTMFMTSCKSFSKMILFHCQQNHYRKTQDHWFYYIDDDFQLALREKLLVTSTKGMN